MLLDNGDHPFAELHREAWVSTGIPACSLASLVWVISPETKASETRCSGEYAIRSPTTSSNSEVGPVVGRICAAAQ